MRFTTEGTESTEGEEVGSEARRAHRRGRGERRGERRFCCCPGDKFWQTRILDSSLRFAAFGMTGAGDWQGSMNGEGFADMTVEQRRSMNRVV